MATTDQIAELRAAINQPDNTDPFTDTFLSSLIDQYGGVDPAAAKLWEIKAGQVAALVNISEGGSSRSMSDLYTHYLQMADRYSTDTDATKRAPRTRAIVRV